MKYIRLTQGKRAIVDDNEYKKLSVHKWWAHRSNLTYYAGSYQNGKRVKMHRIIMKAPPDMQVDHINHNGLDNRKCNLRLCALNQQAQNRVPYKNVSSRYKGVSWREETARWRAEITPNGKRKHIGYFKNEKKAALAYNEKAKEFFGEFAFLNEV